MVEQQVGHIAQITEQIEGLDGRIEEICQETEAVRLLRTIPGIGFVLGVVAAMELGDIGRFATAEKAAAYAGTTPRIHASGGRQRAGSLRTDVNQYLKWAYVEAANINCINRIHHPGRHVSCLYGRLRSKRGHAVAIGAVARHLAEASYWVLTRRQPYHDPGLGSAGPTEAEARARHEL